ncbi:hypothetical protein [Holospora curviuscula]|uniref:hypothetical protein n=1 Tax=Holospora curviuscula TaxID=1082868 RepID=UPI000CE58D5C|nr:hypothetical protein [Holospora curviuscula]
MNQNIKLFKKLLLWNFSFLESSIKLFGAVIMLSSTLYAGCNCKDTLGENPSSFSTMMVDDLPPPSKVKTT